MLGSVVPNPPNVERSPALVVENGGGIVGAVGAVERRHDPSLPVQEWPLVKPSQQSWPPLRCTPSLQAPQGPLIDFLTSGHGYDDQSVAVAVQRANEHFAKRELARAIDFFGAAYEIGRLHFDYKPLMHDLVMRRVICYSMLGDLQKSLEETDLALRVVPHSATALLYRGLLHSKLGAADEANENFHLAVAQCRELRDHIDCIVAFFMLAQGHCDRAIQVCSQVLARKPQFPFALLVRGDAYKFHASGYFARQAADDYTLLLESDIGLQPLIGDRITLQQHARFDELLLRFHPRLEREGPRTYAEYPMCALYRKRRPFLVTALVLLAAAKLKTCVRSTQLVRNVQRRNEELLQARAEAERKVRQLVETQQKLAVLESSSFSEVWGPADPEHVHVRKYRRYWMERPLGFPKRGNRESDGEDEQLEDSVPPTSPALPGLLWEHSCAETLGTLSPSFLGSPATPMMSPGWVSASPREAGSTRDHPQASNEVKLPAAESPVLLFPSHPSATAKNAEPSICNSVQQESNLASAPCPQELADPFGDPHAQEPTVPNASDLLLETPEPSTPPHPAATRRSREDVYADRPPPQKLGAGWSDREWLAKALELADTFANTGPCQYPSPASAPHSPRPTYPNSPCRAKTTLPSGEEGNLVEAIEEYGLKVLPDWFTAVDRIYEVCDMSYFQAEADPLAAAPGLAGAPGYSYIVPKMPPGGRPGSRGARGMGVMGGGVGGGRPLRSSCSEVSGAWHDAEALMQRYQNRLMETTLTGSAGRLR